MLRIATFNINGVRAALRRGYDGWLAEAGLDVLALQEVRCPAPAIPDGAFGDFHVAYDPGELAGRNGVAILTRAPVAGVRTWSGEVLLSRPHEPLTFRDAPVGVVARGLGRWAREGRYVEVDLSDRPVTVASLYLPKGGLPAHLQRPGSMREAPDGGARYARKMAFLEAFGRQLDRARRSARAVGREFVLLGDLNIAHTELDLANWRTSRSAVGFLPEERAWFEAQLGPRRLVDVQRALRPGESGPWSWWSWLGGTFERDVGWRIDYQLATPGLARTAVAERTHRAVTREARMSDHAPVIVDYAF